MAMLVITRGYLPELLGNHVRTSWKTVDGRRSTDWPGPWGRRRLRTNSGHVSPEWFPESWGYPLVMTNIAMENPPFLIGKPSINGPSIPWLCSITKGYLRIIHLSRDFPWNKHKQTIQRAWGILPFMEFLPLGDGSKYEGVQTFDEHIL